MNFKFGILLALPGQQTDDEMFSNGKLRVVEAVGINLGLFETLVLSVTLSPNIP